jgi:hypothetical protein
MEVTAMATRKAKKGTSTARKTKDLPTRTSASVKGGTKPKYEVTIDGKKFQLTQHNNT